MIITVINGERRVDIRVKGHGRKALARAEQAAARLMTTGPEPDPAKTERPFGYSVSGDAGRSYQPDGDHHAE